jgi:hypothetical protein
MEGETIPGRETDFLTVKKGPWAGTLELPFSLRLGSFRHSSWDDGGLREYGSSLSILRPGQALPVDLAVNRPFSSSGVRVYQSPHFGPALSLRLKKPSGEEPVTHFLLDRPSKPGMPALGGADFPTTDYDFRLALRPGGSADGASGGAASVFATITRRSGRPGRTEVVYRGPLPLDRAVAVGDDKVSVAGIRPWTGLVVVADRSMVLAYLGFLLASAGALLMYILPPAWARHA